MRPRALARDVLDAALELTVVGSFSRIGFALRRRIYAWPTNYARLDGRVALVTGATSGLGLDAATSLAQLGAHVILMVRDAERGARVRDDIIARTRNDSVEVVIADLGDLDSVRAAAEGLRRFPAIHVLVHNAGSLQRTYQESAQGIELTAAVHLLGPFLLTRLLHASLEAGRARVIWVSSGGMYAEALRVEGLEMDEVGFDGVKAYARVKRAQVSLVGRWAPDLASKGITMVAMHPGWADTPGVRRSLPTFRRLMGPLLRSSAEGADTIIWLATSQASLAPGGLWLDRRPRPAHRLARTRRSDTLQERERLMQYCRSRASGPDLQVGGER